MSAWKAAWRSRSWDLGSLGPLGSSKAALDSCRLFGTMNLPAFQTNKFQISLINLRNLLINLFDILYILPNHTKSTQSWTQRYGGPQQSSLCFNLSKFGMVCWLGIGTTNSGIAEYSHLSHLKSLQRRSGEEYVCMHAWQIRCWSHMDQDGIEELLKPNRMWLGIDHLGRPHAFGVRWCQQLSYGGPGDPAFGIHAAKHQTLRIWDASFFVKWSWRKARLHWHSNEEGTQQSWIRASTTSSTESNTDSSSRLTMRLFFWGPALVIEKISHHLGIYHQNWWYMIFYHMRGFLKWSNFEWFGGIPILGNLHILGYNRNSSKAAKGAQVWIEFGVLHSFYPFHQDAWINLTWNNTPENNKIIMVFHFSKDMNAKVPVQCIIFGIDGIMGLEIGDMSGFKYAWAWMFQDVQVQVQARHYHLKSNANQKLITICPDQNEQVIEQWQPHGLQNQTALALPQAHLSQRGAGSHFVKPRCEVVQNQAIWFGELRMWNERTTESTYNVKIMLISNCKAESKDIQRLHVQLKEHWTITLWWATGNKMTRNLAVTYKLCSIAALQHIAAFMISNSAAFEEPKCLQ